MKFKRKTGLHYILTPTNNPLFANLWSGIDGASLMERNRWLLREGTKTLVSL